MKKSILIFSAVLMTFSLTAFGYMSWNEPVKTQEEKASSKTAVSNNDFVNPFTHRADIDFYYGIDSRFMTTVTKETLDNAISIIDILPKEATQSLEAYHSVCLTVFHEDEEIKAAGDKEVLNAIQIKLLQSTDYSTDIRITADCKNKNEATGELENYDLVYYITITPEKEAEYTGGQDALIKYLKESSKEERAFIDPGQLQPGKVSFTISHTGDIKNVQLNSSSGYPALDTEMLELISNMPEKWNSATNAAGEKVEQELIFFFGRMGC